MPQPRKPATPGQDSRRRAGDENKAGATSQHDDAPALDPVAEKIGESEGHLRRREEAFNKRRGRTRPSG